MQNIGAMTSLAGTLLLALARLPSPGEYPVHGVPTAFRPKGGKGTEARSSALAPPGSLPTASLPHRQRPLPPPSSSSRA
eukprot:3047888-Rhodomonas_salina.1